MIAMIVGMCVLFVLDHDPRASATILPKPACTRQDWARRLVLGWRRACEPPQGTALVVPQGALGARAVPGRRVNGGEAHPFGK